MIYLCQICGQKFESNYKTASCNSCYDAVFNATGFDILRECLLCSKVFKPRSSRRKMCYDTHYHACPVCGVDVVTIDLQHLNTCCCKEHSRIAATNTIHRLYPHGEYCRNVTSDSKRAATNLARYGVDNPFKSLDIQAKARSTFLRKYKVNGIMQVPEIRSRVEATNLQKYGSKHPMQSDEVKSRIRSTIQDKYNVPGLRSTLELEEVKSKCDATNLKKYGTTIPMQSHDIWAKQSSKKSKYFATDGTKLDSTYEVILYEFCRRNNLNIERNVRLTYEYEGINHVTFIDFQIEGQYFECKGSHILDGYFDHRGVPIAAKLEVYKKYHVIVVTDKLGSSQFGKPNSAESNGLKYLHKCSEPLIGVDIDLFRKNPVFPYRDDRPHCFYDVKVDGSKSSYEAFYDESIRWNMILNRIQYSGGFIDGKQVLNALNVTRTCKQPSWFSKEFAKRVISKYCTSDTIVDPFAGWGARCDAANELHRVYIGSDLNPALVQWHHDCGRANITQADATTYTFSNRCSVFICPPYSDPVTGRCFEDYNFEGFDISAKQLSQCDWLKVVMKNIPNATEYVMVCKIVDPGWEKYIVETKENKSHFGTNREYVIVVKNINPQVEP